MRTGRAAVLPTAAARPGRVAARRALDVAGPGGSHAALRLRARRLRAARPATALHHHRHAALAAGVAARRHGHWDALLQVRRDQYDAADRRQALRRVETCPVACARCQLVLLHNMVQSSPCRSTGPMNWCRCACASAAARGDGPDAPRIATGGAGVAERVRADGRDSQHHCWLRPHTAPLPTRLRPPALPLPGPRPQHGAHHPSHVEALGCSLARRRAAVGERPRRAARRRGARRGGRVGAERRMAACGRARAAGARGCARHAALRREGPALGARHGGRAGNERVRRAARSGGRHGLRAATRCVRQGRS